MIHRMHSIANNYEKKLTMMQGRKPNLSRNSPHLL